MNESAYFVFLILEISKTLKHESWYDYIKAKFQWNCIQNNSKLYFMDTDIRYKKAIRFMKDKLGGKISTEFMVLRQKHILN